MKFNHILALSLFVSAIAACSTTQQPVQPTIEEVITINETSYYNSIWFDQNSAKISEDYDSIIDLNANYLLSNPLAQIQIQGNSSEAGSSEHNKKLAAARAKAVKDRLIMAGVNQTQIQDISFGSAKPLFKKPESNKNRRVDIIYISGAPSPYFIERLPVVATEDETVEFEPMNIKSQTQKIKHVSASSTTVVASAPIVNITAPTTPSSAASEPTATISSLPAQ